MTIVREFREAWRRLLRRPGYTALSVLVLGVGLGVMTFVFAGVNSVALHPLALPQANRLVAIGEPGSDAIGDMDSDQFLALKDRFKSVDTLGALVAGGVNLDAGSGAIRENGAHMTATMMGMLGVKPLLGRGLEAADDAPGAPRVVLLGESVWRHVFGANPQIIGRGVRVDGAFATVVGVLPRRFGFPGATNVWLPLQLRSGEHRAIFVAGRLAPSMSIGEAQAELDAWDARLARVLPAGMHTQPPVVAPLSAGFVPRDLAHWIWLMFGAGLLVLILACGNVANLQLVQTLKRRHELALRSALGSSRMRLVGGALAESVLLGIAALAVALPVAKGGQVWIDHTWLDAHPAQQIFMRGIDGWVVGFSVLIAIACTVLAGGIPAWRASRANLEGTLRDGGKGSGRGFAHVARAMTVAEVALTVVLLVGAGMFVRAVNHLLSEPAVGATHASHVLVASVALPATAYPADAARIRFFRDVTAALRRDPAVLDAVASNSVPGGELGSHEDVSLPGRAQPDNGWPRAQMAIAGPQFLATYGVKLLQGRFFDMRDVAGSQNVAVIDARMAAQFWPRANALGRTLVLYPGKPYAEKLTVIGIVQTLKLADALEPARPSLLIPLSQASGASPLRRVGIAVRTRGPAAAFGQQLAAIVHAVDPQAAVYGVLTQARAMQVSRLGLTVLANVFAAVGLVALLLAAAGLYGVLAFSVAQRTRELGIRRAIGAGHGAIVRTVARQLAWQLGIGLAIGLALAVPWSDMLANPGLGTRAHDPLVFGPVLLVVVGASLLAALVPLARALRVDPAEALRYE